MRYVDELTDAVRSQLALAYGIKDQLGSALRSRLKEGYTLADLRADAMAGLVVGIVALPLSMALAKTTGVAPQHGLYTAIIAGIVCALLGGSRMQITGPTAAFVVILEPIVARHGVGGLLVAGFMAGVILVLMGVARLGKLMQFIPHPVTTGFTAGIAVVIAVIQLRDAFGIHLPGKPHGTIDFLGALWDGRASASGWDALVCGVTLALLIGLPRIIKRVPAPLLAMVAAAGLTALLAHLIDGFHANTIGSTFTVVIDGETVHGIPPLPPLPVLPWHLGDAHGQPFSLTYGLIRELLPSAFAIAVLGAIESLMSAVIADGMAGTKHDPNAELIALGVGNMVCPFFGGIACTGALARTATNIRAGARSPLSSVVHALFILACTIALAPLMAYLPLAAMAALLFVVAKNMSEVRHFVRLIRIAPRSDVLVLLTCFTLTVVFDMVIAVSVGVMLAALLFMRRMAVLTKVTLDTGAAERFDMPPGVRMYEIAGPMFFGAAHLAMETLETIGGDTRTLILSMTKVDVMDATGLVALESMLDQLGRDGRKVIVAGLGAEPRALVERAGIKRIPGRLAFAPDVDTAVSMAIVHTARTPT
ncbi:MAG: C4-dicarboxylic acid transporter DauA [Myxococcales bacterium]|nr:C4-dicarboxylic acid transporter DauA [Myxococcales bacterium]